MKQKVAFLIACICFMLAMPIVIHAETVPNWNGQWDSRWKGGGARLYLEQNGNQVSGTYPLYNGRIVATAKGTQLQGRWIEGERSGEFLFVLSPDGENFTGRFETGEWWTGNRVVSLNEANQLLDQSTPQNTMRSFLNIMNNLQANSIDMVGLAAGVLRADEQKGQKSNVIDQTELLYKVLDRLTFRIWSLPDDRDASTNRLSIELAQSGTDVKIPVVFEKHQKDWFIVPPSTEELERQLASLEAARPLIKPSEAGPITPRDAFRDFILGYKSDIPAQRETAIQAMNLSELSSVSQSSEAYILAGYLKRVLDRVGYIIWQEIPDDPNYPTEYVHFEHGSGSIIVQSTDTESGKIWRFSPETMSTIRKLYSSIQDMPVDKFISSIEEKEAYFKIRNAVEDYSPTLLRPSGLLELWQWLALICALPLAWLAGYLASLFQRRFSGADDLSAGWLHQFAQNRAASLLFTGVTLINAQRVLGLPDIIGSATTTVGWLLSIITVTLVLFRIIKLVADRYQASEDLSGQAKTLISMLAGLLRIAVAVAAILLMADILNLPYQGILAGLGIGGLAVALAAQSTLQNFIAGITLYVDRPISVGDFCRFGDKLGTVEYIGFRSTRIRTLDRTLVVIPNSDFSSMTLENYAHRDRIWLKTVLQLRYETTPDQLRYVIAELRKLLIAHPKVAPDPTRVRFIGFGEYSLDVEIYAYILTSDNQEYLAIREDIYLHIMSLMEQAGAQFAFPSAIEYQAEDQKSDPKLIKAAEQNVEKWRTDGKLPFPDYDWQDKSELSSTLEYPPEGSALSEQMKTPFTSK